MLTHGCPGDWIVAAFHFDFRAGLDLRNSIDGMVRSILLLLLEKFEEIKILLKPYMAPTFRSLARETEGLRSLMSGKASAPGIQNVRSVFARDGFTPAKAKEVLETALSKCSQHLCLFVDGLDECDGDSLEVVRFLKKLAQDDSAGNLEKSPVRKVCFANRPDKLLESALERYPGLRMQDFNKQGIREYLHRRLDEVGFESAYGEEASNSLVRDTTTRADGVFLWAKFAADELLIGHEQGEDASELRDRLEVIPEGLQDVYRRVLSSLSKKDRYEAAVVLHLVGAWDEETTFYARNGFKALEVVPLTLQHLLVAAKYFVTGKRVRLDKDWLLVCKRYRIRLRFLIGGLIDFVPASKVFGPADDAVDIPIITIVKLTHETVRGLLSDEPLLEAHEYERFGKSPWLTAFSKYLQFDNPVDMANRGFLPGVSGDYLSKTLFQDQRLYTDFGFHAAHYLFEAAFRYEQQHRMPALEYLEHCVNEKIMQTHSLHCLFCRFGATFCETSNQEHTNEQKRIWSSYRTSTLTDRDLKLCCYAVHALPESCQAAVRAGADFLADDKRAIHGLLLAMTPDRSTVVLDCVTKLLDESYVLASVTEISPTQSPSTDGQHTAAWVWREHKMKLNWKVMGRLKDRTILFHIAKATRSPNFVLNKHEQLCRVLDTFIKYLDDSKLWIGEQGDILHSYFETKDYGAHSTLQEDEAFLQVLKIAHSVSTAQANLLDH